MRDQLLFGSWKPDTLPFLTNDLQTARNVYASSNGYRPVKSPTQIAEALPGTFKGGAAYVASDGTTRMIAGDDTALYTVGAGVWTQTVGSLTVDSFWQFAQFGDDVVCVNGGAPLAYDLVAGTAGNLAGSPPTADLVTVVRDFVVLGRTDGNILMVTWSGFNDHESWTLGVDQSGEQPMLSGGKVMGLAGGEYGLILQRFAITRMSYTGDPDVPFQFDKISEAWGCVAEGSVAQAGDLVFCLSDRGFIKIQGGGITPIGAEKFDRFYRDKYSPDQLTQMTACVDPDKALYVVCMPGYVLCYNWVLDQATEWEFPVQAVFPSFSESITLDSLDALFSSVDDCPYTYDDPRFAGGEPRLTTVGVDGVFNALGGPALEAKFTSGSLELANGRNTRFRFVRPLTDALNMSLTLETADRLGSTFQTATYTEIRANGDMPVRENSRYVRPTLTIPAGEVWSYAVGMVFDGEAGGRH